MRSRAVFLAPLLLAAALRFPDLASRPMHADEAVHADKFGTLLEGGGYAYDPSEYHGPTLYYLALLPAWLRGEARYVEIDEVILRIVPAVLGVALVAAHFEARGLLGTAGALVALSPSMVFYSRYFIHETALVLWTFGALLAGCRHRRSPSTGAALVANVCAGLMLATKETERPFALLFPFAIGSWPSLSPSSWRPPSSPRSSAIRAESRRCARMVSTWIGPAPPPRTSTLGTITCACWFISPRRARPSGPRGSSSGSRSGAASPAG